MFVCICNAIRDRDLRDAALRCDGDAEAVYRVLGRTPHCRQCLDDAEDLISEERALVRAMPELVTVNCSRREFAAHCPPG